MRMKNCWRFIPVFVLAGAHSLVHAGEIAQATFIATQLGLSSWQYDLTLDDTGTTNIGTFWFGWVPGEDFLATDPTNVLSPASWTDNITHGGASDGFAIQWVAGVGAALTPGNSLQGFEFDSTISPTDILANSPFYPTPMLTSFVYSGGPFSDAGFEFAVQAVSPSAPEPANAVPAAIGVLGILCLVARRNHQSRASGD